MIETIDCVLGGNMLRRMLVAQCGVTALLALALWLFGPNLLHSALLGAGIGVAGNGYAAWRVFAGSRSKNGSVAMFELYRAEFGKLVIIGVLCGCAFMALEDLNFAAFLGGLVSVTLASVVAAATHTVELPEQLGRQI
jgi:F0F1-type ATP synthase assembly protein I